MEVLFREQSSFIMSAAPRLATIKEPDGRVTYRKVMPEMADSDKVTLTVHPNDAADFPGALQWHVAQNNMAVNQIEPGVFAINGTLDPELSPADCHQLVKDFLLLKDHYKSYAEVVKPSRNPLFDVALQTLKKKLPAWAQRVIELREK